MWYFLALFVLIIMATIIAMSFKGIVLLIAMYLHRHEREPKIDVFTQYKYLQSELSKYYHQLEETNKPIILAKQYAYYRLKVPIGTPIHVPEEETMVIKAEEIKFMINAIEFQMRQLELSSEQKGIGINKIVSGQGRRTEYW